LSVEPDMHKSRIGPILPLVAALFYGVSPVDLIPDLIPLIGFADDAVIVPTLILLAIVQYRRSREKLRPVPQPIR
jgi:uncharacterized membrane protein YkvA (DUF1232 family)